MTCVSHNPPNYGCQNDTAPNPNPGTPCPTNMTTFSTDTVVRDEHINELRTAINDEKARRGEVSETFTDTIAVGGVIKGLYVEELQATIEAMKSFTWVEAYTNLAGSTIKDEYFTELRTNVNTVEAECLCDCNYCTCDCNYCTCNCNYGCTCNCNHSCTCNCAYSDERLKIEIVYF